MTENTDAVTAVVADDQSAVREGLVLLLGTLPGIAVIGEAEDGEAAVEAVATKNPQVVLMDLNMPRCDGVEATRRIRASHPQTQVVVLTTYSDDDSIIAALQAGALGYLTKDATRAEIGRAVLAAAAGQAVLDPAVQQRLLSAAARAPAGLILAVHLGGLLVDPQPAPARLAQDPVRGPLGEGDLADQAGLYPAGLPGGRVGNLGTERAGFTP
jgi:DNA-binding NarL/FixJ family response regulator